ncbi:MAG TPA: hypothetical protein VFZ59_17885 [Verrucomicrobiae bacterium]|nr:hypothetical protein [Verrucomicrobiae bacterium]
MSAQFLSGAVFQFNAPGGIQNEHRVRKRSQGCFHRVMQADDLLINALAVFIQLSGHLVESGRQFPQFILRKNGHRQIKFTFADFPGRFGERLDGMQNALTELVTGINRDEERDNQAKDQQADNSVGAALEGISRRKNIFTISLAKMFE